MKDIKNFEIVLDNIIKIKRNKPNSLLEILFDAQEHFGYLSEQTQDYVAKAMMISTSNVNKFVAQYNFFLTEAKSKYKINICVGEECYRNGAGELLKFFRETLHIKLGETSEDKLYSLNSVKCLGACDRSPVFQIENRIFSGVNNSIDLLNILKEFQ